MAGRFILREVKARFGLPCTEDGSGLWIAKGKGPRGLPLMGLLETDEVNDIQDTLLRGRGKRRGRFWVHRAERKVTMMIGSKNKTKTLHY